MEFSILINSTNPFGNLVLLVINIQSHPNAKSTSRKKTVKNPIRGRIAAFAASDRVLQCFTMPYKIDAMLIWASFGRKYDKFTRVMPLVYKGNTLLRKRPMVR